MLDKIKSVFTSWVFKVVLLLVDVGLQIKNNEENARQESKGAALEKKLEMLRRIERATKERIEKVERITLNNIEKSDEDIFGAESWNKKEEQ